MRVDQFQKVRQDAAFVVTHASHVAINDAKLQEFGHALRVGAKQRPFWDAQQHFVGSKDEMAAFVVQFSAINFGLSSHSPIQQIDGLDAYRTVAQRLTDRFQLKGPLSVDELLGANSHFCATVFRQRLVSEDLAALMGSYARAWRELGTFLKNEHDGSLPKFLLAARGSADEALRGLITMPMFRDEADYKGRHISFFARAQMCLSDLNLALENQRPADFDVRKFTAFANESVPHLLHVRGVLTYEPALEAKIQQGVRLAAGGAEEVEIRAASIYAIDILAQTLSTPEFVVTARDIDCWSWRQAEQQDVVSIPSHYARTCYY